MNDSITSADDNQHRIKNCLFNQIQEMNSGDWQNDINFSLDHSHNESLNESRQNNSFDTDLPIESKIIQPIIEVQHIFDEPANNLEENSPNKEIISQEPLESISSNSSIPSQVTITLHEESICSKIYEEIDTVDSSGFSISLKSFLSLNDKNYKPHVKCLKFLYCKLKDYSKRSLQNLKNYITFTQVKMKQQIESLRFLDSLEAVGECDANIEQFSIDEKVILTQIKETNIKRRQQRKVFYNSIKIEYERLLHCWRKIKERREKRERQIDEQIIRVLDRIQLEMEDMIICRLQSQREKVDGKFISEKIRSKNPYLTKDKYLQMKYLMQRQKAYLKLITDLSGKVITYMVSIFSKQEPQIARTIKQSMLNYATHYMECYDQHNHILNLKIQALEDQDCESNVKKELVDLLLTMVPMELYNLQERRKDIRNEKGEDKLLAILQDLSDCLQNTIFLQTIEMNNQFILFRNQAVWKTSSSILDKEESGILYQSRNDTKFESKQALAQSRPTLTVPETARKKNIRVVVVLTSNYYLHLEYEDKIATLKLGQIKLSKRGREIVISNKEKGFGGYFGIKRELGALEFQSTSEVEQFAHKLSRALSRIG